jgi:tRNA threonylcarbamoyladenosine biosynthesis protein TsaB
VACCSSWWKQITRHSETPTICRGRKGRGGGAERLPALCGADFNMLLLAADTSGKYGSIALAKGNQDGSCEIIEVVPLAGGTFSAQLIPQLAALLSKHGFRGGDLGGFVIASGPGSFTGLRVGLAAIKALGEATGKPIAAVSLLEAVASMRKKQGVIWAALDAGRDQVYLGEYEVGEKTKLVSERLLTQQEFLAEVEGHRVVTPDESIATAAGAVGVSIERVQPPWSGVIAKLGWEKILGGQSVSPEELEANYLRRSDAEIFSKIIS